MYVLYWYLDPLGKRFSSVHVQVPLSLRASFFLAFFLSNCLRNLLSPKVFGTNLLPLGSSKAAAAAADSAAAEAGPVATTV